jgi:L-arabinose isomerase
MTSLINTVGFSAGLTITFLEVIPTGIFPVTLLASTVLVSKKQSVRNKTNADKNFGKTVFIYFMFAFSSNKMKFKQCRTENKKSFLNFNEKLKENPDFNQFDK